MCCHLGTCLCAYGWVCMQVSGCGNVCDQLGVCMFGSWCNSVCGVLGVCMCASGCDIEYLVIVVN